MRYLDTLILASATLLLASCAASQPDGSLSAQATETAQKTRAVGTVKPGAAVQFQHKVESDFAVGQVSDIIVTARGDVETLSLSAKGTEDLDVVNVSSQFFGDGEAPSWRVSVRPKTGGVHYLNLFGVTKSGNGDFSRARVQSIRVDLGGRAKSTNDLQKPALVQSESGPVAIFKAEESTQP